MLIRRADRARQSAVLGLDHRDDVGQTIRSDCLESREAVSVKSSPVDSIQWKASNGKCLAGSEFLLEIYLFNRFYFFYLLDSEISERERERENNLKMCT